MRRHAGGAKVPIRWGLRASCRWDVAVGTGKNGRGAVVERLDELFDRCRSLRHFQNLSTVPLHLIGRTQVLSAH
jgi:hypothetical protein